MNSEHNDVSSLADCGPWLVGLPSIGRRSLTSAELSELRLCLRGRAIIVAALLLPLPLMCIGCALGFQMAPGDVFPLYMFGGMIEIVILFGCLAVSDSPISRLFVTYRDYRQGVVERGAGVITGERAGKNAERQSGASLYGTPGDALALIEIRFDLLRVDGKPSTIERLPYSGRLWSVNDERVCRWLEIGWDGLAKPPADDSLERSSCDPNRWSFIDDIAIGMPFFAILVTVVAHNIWVLPWYGLILIFFNTMIVSHHTMAWFNRPGKN